MDDVSHGQHGEILQHLGHQAIAWALRLILQFPSCSKDYVDGDSDSRSWQRNQTVSSASLLSNPLRLHSTWSSQHLSLWALISSVHSSLSSLARPSPQSFFTTGLCTILPLGRAPTLASNSLRAFRAFSIRFLWIGFMHFAASVAIILISCGILNLHADGQHHQDLTRMAVHLSSPTHEWRNWLT